MNEWTMWIMAVAHKAEQRLQGAYLGSPAAAQGAWSEDAGRYDWEVSFEQAWDALYVEITDPIQTGIGGPLTQARIADFAVARIVRER